MALQNEIWSKIKSEYEHGASKNALAEKYGVSRQAIIKRSQKERWIAPVHPEMGISEDLLNMPVSAFLEEATEQEVKGIVEVALMMLVRIAEHMKTEELEIKDLKLLADTLATCNKVLTTREVEQDQQHYDLRLILAKATTEELEIIRPVIAAITDRDKEQQPGNITPFRKQG